MTKALIAIAITALLFFLGSQQHQDSPEFMQMLITGY